MESTLCEETGFGRPNELNNRPDFDCVMYKVRVFTTPCVSLQSFLRFSYHSVAFRPVKKKKFVKLQK